MKKRIVSLALAFKRPAFHASDERPEAFAQTASCTATPTATESADMSDVNLMEQYIDGDAEAQAAIHFAEADVNVDSVVNSDDVALVKKVPRRQHPADGRPFCTGQF